MMKFTVTVYAENDHNYDYPVGEVDIRAADWDTAEEVADMMFNNTGRVISVKENG